MKKEIQYQLEKEELIVKGKKRTVKSHMKAIDKFQKVMEVCSTLEDNDFLGSLKERLSLSKKASRDVLLFDHRLPF